MFSAAGEIAARVPGAQFLVALAPNLNRSVVADILEREQRRGGAATLLQLMHEASGAIVRAATAAISIPPVNPGTVLATSQGMLIDPSDVEKVGKSRAKVVRPTSVTNAPVAVVEGMTYDVIARADLVIATSGTATLETAILNRPMIIVYRGSKVMEIEWAFRKKQLNIDFIGMPNILANRKICPELIQEQATSSAISDIAVDMLLEPDALMKMKEELRRIVREQLGQSGSLGRTAQFFARQILKGGANN
jgi:lipid A disaccharide synthetase